MWPVVAMSFVKTRLTPAIKRPVTAVAEQEFLTESAWLKRLVVRELQAVNSGPDAATTPTSSTSGLCLNQLGKERRSRSRRVYLRLRPEDRQLLEARAAARGMRPATYVSILTRSHLRRLAPLPKDELLTLRRSIAELAAIGRNVNQIASFAHKCGRLPPSLRQECWAMLKVCEGLRVHTKALLMANLASWESGYHS